MKARSTWVSKDRCEHASISIGQFRNVYLAPTSFRRSSPASWTEPWEGASCLAPKLRGIRLRANGRNIVGCYMLRPFPHPVACCCAKFETGQTFQPTTPNISFVLWSPKRSAQCWIRLYSSSNIVAATHAITHGLQRLMACILPTMHCRSQQCWELLHPFAHHCQHRRNNSQNFCANNVGSCCRVRLHAP